MQSEMQIWQEYELKYKRQFPTPEKPQAKLMHTIGWQFIMTLIQSVGAITLASLRTAEMFYIAAAGANPWLKYGEAIAAVLTVEVGIVVFAAIRAEQENSKSTDEEQSMAVKVSLQRLYWGEGLALLISVVAGLGVSFRGFKVDVPLFIWVLSIVIGIGASVIAAVSGDILGAMLARFGNIQNKIARDYAAEIQEYQNKLIAAWEKSPEREIARNDITALRNDLRSRRSSPVRSPVRSQRTSERTNEQEEEERKVDTVNPVAQKIFDYLDRYMAAHPTEDIPGPSFLEREVGVAKSYASKQVKIWAAGHPEFPMSDTYEEQVADAIN